MESYFLEYLLGTLDARRRRQVEAYLAEHPEARGRLALLKDALAPLAFDEDAHEPPPLLAERTLARVAEHICGNPPGRIDLPHAPPVSPASIPLRSWWRRADVLVAACLLVMVGGIGLIVLGSLRGPSSAAVLAECQNNLREFYFALQTFRNTHGQFPDVAKESPRDVAGMVVPILKDAGALPAGASIRCPGVGGAMTCQLTLPALRTMPDAEFAQHSPCLAVSYAYSLGYRDENGVYHGPGAGPKVSLSQLPILADRAPADGALNNSANHGGGGQNVLFADGHVQFLMRRTFAGEDDIFTNRRNLVAAGLDPADVVLGYSAARP